MNWITSYILAAAVATLPAGAAALLAEASARPAERRIRAFPSAEGYGAFSLGGRGGKVLYVSSLADSGPGTLRWATEDVREPRIVLFNVAGIIELERPITIRSGRITIAGQSAPPGGVTLKNYGITVSDASEVVIRHLRIRPGGKSLAHLPDDFGGAAARAKLAFKEADALNIGSSTQIVIDHCSLSWSTDELLNVYQYVPAESTDVTLQWNIISEALHDSVHPPLASGRKYRHSCGSNLILGRNSRHTLHHNLYAHNAFRNPVMQASFLEPGGSRSSVRDLQREDEQVLDFVNNVIYNWAYAAGHAYLVALNDGRQAAYELRLNYAGNLLLPGPDTLSPFAPGTGVASPDEAASYERGHGPGAAYNTALVYSPAPTGGSPRFRAVELAELRARKALALVPKMRLFMRGNEVVRSASASGRKPAPVTEDELLSLTAPDAKWDQMVYADGVGDEYRRLGLEMTPRYVVPGQRRRAVAIEGARAALARVLARAGATAPERDSVDARVVRGLEACLASPGPCIDRAAMGHIVNSQEDLSRENGGYPVNPVRRRCNRASPQSPCPAPFDADEDGIPDSEGRPSGYGYRIDSSTGYTQAELYLNRVAGD